MLRILTLSINYYGEKHGDWMRRRELIRSAIAEVDADVVAQGPAMVTRLEVAETDYLDLTLRPGLEDTNRRVVLHPAHRLRLGKPPPGRGAGARYRAPVASR